MHDKKILLGICGSIAAYKAALLIRELRSLGAIVKIVMTASAQQFITPLTMQALSGNDVRIELFDVNAELAMNHIELARWADILLIAPASANCLSKLASGYADDLLSTIYLVNKNPVIICPAMNKEMWAHPATQKNCTILRRQHKALIISPKKGLQACGEYGAGCLPDTQTIIDSLRLINVKNLLIGQQVMITAGATREYIDPVRFISNRSSGKMGYALAMAAKIAGAEVTLISGITNLSSPDNINIILIQSAQDMYTQVQHAWRAGMIFIGCAAVADYTIAKPSTQKIKKQINSEILCNLQLTPDIISAVAELQTAKYIIGFAAEVDNLLQYARDKLVNKNLDMIVANQVGESLGFDQDDNQAMIITKNQELHLATMHKTNMAGEIIKFLAQQLRNKDVASNTIKNS